MGVAEEVQRAAGGRHRWKNEGDWRWARSGPVVLLRSSVGIGHKSDVFAYYIPTGAFYRPFSKGSKKYQRARIGTVTTIHRKWLTSAIQVISGVSFDEHETADNEAAEPKQEETKPVPRKPVAKKRKPVPAWGSIPAVTTKTKRLVLVEKSHAITLREDHLVALLREQGVELGDEVTVQFHAEERKVVFAWSTNVEEIEE